MHSFDENQGNPGSVDENQGNGRAEIPEMKKSEENNSEKPGAPQADSAGTEPASSQDDSAGKKSGGRTLTWWKILLVAAAFVLLLAVLDLALYPCTFMRNDIHAITTTHYDDILVGTSHGKMGIDPDTVEEITGRSMHNACVGGEYGIDVYYLVRLAIETQDPTRIIYEVGPGCFVREKEEGNNYLLFYHEYPLSLTKVEYFFDCIAETNFRNVLFPWYEYSLSYELPNVTETFIRKVTGDYSVESLKSDSQEYHESGFIESYPIDTSTLQLTVPNLFTTEAVVEENMEYLEKTIDLCEENGIEFIAVITPIPAATLGTWWDNYMEAYEYFAEFFAGKGVTCLNFNTDYYFEASHEIEDFTDYDGHMNGDAAREFSKVLASYLNEASGTLADG
ncbi:MAG: hypothetical protein LUF35_03570 [Lachnospiraceae bacterium]|nr:hypothetical protein [Lachnospiraceae bacterium]